MYIFGYWKCMFVDFLTEYIGPPYSVHIECRVVIIEAPIPDQDPIANP